MRVGIIGCGNIAKVHAWSLANMEKMEIACFADIKIDRAKAMSEEYTKGAAKAYSNYVDMLDECSLDCVHICSPHYLHVPMAIEALKRDISVFMEKPPAVSESEFNELGDALNGSKGRIGFCFQNRYNATTKALDEIFDKKNLGEIIGARAVVTWKRDESYYCDDWHGSLEKECGGVLINQSIHTLDLLLRYLGEPVNVEASMSNHHLKGVIEVEDTLEAWLEFNGNKRACFYASTGYASDAPIILEIDFSDGRATLMDKAIYIKKNGSDPEIILCKEEATGVGKSYWGNGHLVCIRDFYKCLNDGSKYVNDYDGVKNTLLTTMKIYEKARGEQ